LAKKKKVEKRPREMTRRQLSHFKRQKRRQRIIFIGGVAIIAAVILIILVGWFVGEYRPMHKGVIIVKDTEFNTAYFADYLKFAGANYADENIESLADTAVNTIIQNELVRQAAENLGMTISDEEAKKELEDTDFKNNRAAIDLVRAYLLEERLRSEYFDAEVPVSDNQVHMMTMLLESGREALEVRDKLSSENFTVLAGEFALNYYSKNVNSGDFGWHPATILEDQLESSIPIDFAFGAEAGTLSHPLEDEEVQKQRGYWLIKVLEKPDEEKAPVQALFLGSEQEAEGIRDRLVAGDNMTAIADEYTQYDFSKENHGELGVVVKDQINAVFDDYVFSDNVTVGEWSQPVRDDTLWTKGGYWLVKVVDKDDDRELSDEDRSTLIDKVYSDWVSGLWTESAASIGSPGLTTELRQMAIDKVLNERK
jgi:parvulin-like peptidyl-prolyl isomerase